MIGPDDIEAAHARIAAHVRRTPVIDVAGAPYGLAQPLSLKLECLQHTGSFKPRGAFNNLFSRRVPAAGVAAASGGKHGAAVAVAAAALGHPAAIFVPEIASLAKVVKIRRAGADVHVAGARYADALALCEAHQAATGAIGIHAYDAAETIAGQGTVALEWLAQAPDLDTVLVAVGGGGLIAGIAAYLEDRVRVVAVEPETSCCLYAARKAGRPVEVPVEGIAADSLGAKSCGALAFEIAERFVEETLLVPDDAIRAAQAHLWRDLQLAAEPGGATALAALIAGAYRPSPTERVGVLVCGANVALAHLLRDPGSPPARV
jgi:threonine dehydratase